MDLGGGGQGGKRDRWRGLSFTAGEGPMASERPLEVEPETAGGGTQLSPGISPKPLLVD